MAPQEKQNSLETPQIKEVAKENNSPKEKLQKIFDTSTLKPETIENLKKILSLVDINELNDFIIGEPDLDDAINKGLDIDVSLSLEGIIDNFLMKFGEAKTDKIAQEKIKKGNFEDKKEISDISQTKINNEETEKKEQVEKTGIELLKKNDSKYRELFKGDANIIQILDDIKANEKDPTKVAELLNKFLSDKENATKFFDTIAKSGDKALYEETISSFRNLGVTIPAYISPTPSIPEPVKPTDPIISQFPGAKPQDIEKRGNLVSYGDKTIDLKTGKAFISGEGGYAIETSMKVPNSLDLRVKYQKERLEILEEIKTNEKILNLLENKESLKEKLQDLKKQKSSDGKNASDLQLDIEITAIEKELQKIDEKLKHAIPGYKEDDDKNLKTFLKEKIEESKTSLKGLKEKFDADMQKLLEAGKDEIASRDEKIRETISFLDDLGITNINQHDLQKIIRRINIHPQNYGFSKPIDLKKGFEGSATESHKQKKEFFNFFSKMYEKMGFTNPPISHSVVEGINKDPRLKNDTTFKQRLEDTGVTLGGALQIETFFTLIKEEPKKPQNTQEQ